jgi:AMMECR1 domain-containing protein
MDTHQTLDLVLSILAIAAPIITISGLLAGTIIFVRYRGTMDALKQAAETYERLADARADEIDDLKCKIEVLTDKVKELTIALQERDNAIAIIRTEIVAAIKEGNGGE